MGDIRYDEVYHRIADAQDRSRAVRALSDVEVTHALAAVSRRKEPYLANILASELENRMTKRTMILETAPAGMIALDPDNTITYVNPAGERLLGRTLEDLVGRSFFEAVTVVQDEPEGRLEGTLERGETLTDHMASLRPRNAPEFVASCSCSPILRDGRVEGVVVFVQDITQRATVFRKRAEMAAILEASTDAIIALDLHGRVRAWNQAAEDLYGYRASQIVGKPLELLAPPGGGQELGRLIVDVSAGHTRETELDLLTHRGDRVAVAVSASPIRGKNDEITGIASIHRDVTSRNRAQTRLRLIQGLALDVAAKDTFDDALQVCLDRIGERLQTKLGQVWIHSPQRDYLHLGSMWTATDDRLIQFRTKSAAFTWRRGQGFPGRVWERGSTLAIGELHADPAFPRAPFALAAGLRSIVAMPIFGEDDLLAILEFFSDREGSIDDETMQELDSLAAAISPALEKRRQTDMLRASEEKFRTMAETAMDAILATDHAGKITYLNASAEHLFLVNAEDALGRDIGRIVPAWTELDAKGALTLPTSEREGGFIECLGRTSRGGEVPLAASIARWTARGAHHFTIIVRPS